MVRRFSPDVNTPVRLRCRVPYYFTLKYHTTHCNCSLQTGTPVIKSQFKTSTSIYHDHHPAAAGCLELGRCRYLGSVLERRGVLSAALTTCYFLFPMRRWCLCGACVITCGAQQKYRKLRRRQVTIHSHTAHATHATLHTSFALFPCSGEVELIFPELVIFMPTVELAGRRHRLRALWTRNGECSSLYLTSQYLYELLYLLNSGLFARK